MRLSNLGNGGFFPNDVQQRPRQVFACAQVSKDAFDRRGKSQRARAQKQRWVAANARVAGFLTWRAILEKLSPRGQLHHDRFRKAG